jgi:hypothetical protein
MLSDRSTSSQQARMDRHQRSQVRPLAAVVELQQPVTPGPRFEQLERLAQ